MSKRLFLVMMMSSCLSLFSFACGDDGDDEGEGGSDGSGGDGSDSPDNQTACENWKSAVSCEGADLSLLEQVNCGSYANTTCDVAPYFDCLADNTGCNGGVLDVSGWTNCTNLATCN